MQSRYFSVKLKMLVFTKGKNEAFPVHLLSPVSNGKKLSQSFLQEKKFRQNDLQNSLTETVRW